jgi:hypothetical protein
VGGPPPEATPATTHGSLQRFAPRSTFEYLSTMANEIAIVDGEDLRKRAGALRRFL